jgi:hypothetical protein
MESGQAEAEGHTGEASVLGPEVLRCRPTSPMTWVASQGLGLLGAYLVLPLVILPFFALWPAVGVLRLLQDGPAWLQKASALGCFASVYACLVWLVYLQPRGDYLVLCQRGFRLKITTFKPREVLFEELRAISFGLNKPGFIRGAEAVARLVRPGFMAMVDEMGSAAMNLHYRNGKTVVFKSFLHRFVPEDTKQFPAHLAKEHPELLPDDS